MAGGMEPVFRVGDVVLKRADGPAEVSWKSELLSALPESGFRLARPVRSRDGGWIVEGWMASAVVPGDHDPSRLAELLAAARAFHGALAATPRPEFLDGLDHRWARAHRVAWGQAPPQPLSSVAPCLARLVGMLEPVSVPSQVIHGDLAGNVLFAPGLAPAILDFSPWWAPVAYAEGILMADALLWLGADETSVSLIADRADYPQMLLRGAIFRLVALNEGAQEGHPEFLDELPLFDRLAELISSILSAP